MKMKRILSLFLVFVMLCGTVSAVSVSKLQTAVSGSAANMLQTVKNPQVASIGGEWAVIGLARSGYDVPQSWYDKYYETVEEYVEDCGGVLHNRKYTEYSRVILALTAIGADPSDVAGYDLLAPLADFDKTVWQGINGPIWALIALDGGNYLSAIRQRYVDEVLANQLADGGWALDGELSDPDMTGMALTSLAKYKAQPAVQAAINRALVWLSNAQDRDGGYSSWQTSNSESVVQVIVALAALGIDLEDSRFVKNGNTLLDNLMSFRQKDGSFRHTADGSGNDQMSSEQGLYGLVAALRAEQGKNSLYDMSDVKKTTSGTADTGAVGLAGKHADVKTVPVTAAGKTFQDIAGHANQTAIEDLASRAIISGKGDGSAFDPNATMTRAEFAVIVVRALGLEGKTTKAFRDVASGAWYAPYIGTASTYGIISGDGKGNFLPNGTITREQAASMVARAAALCGMETDLADYEVLNMLAQFTDYVTVSAWARESVAFCYGADILDQSDLDVQPKTAILRCEIAQMLYNLLDGAKLL